MVWKEKRPEIGIWWSTEIEKREGEREPSGSGEERGLEEFVEEPVVISDSWQLMVVEEGGYKKEISRSK